MGEAALKMEAATVACESAYARVMLSDYNKERVGVLTKIQEGAESPYVVASKAAKESGSSLPDEATFHASWKVIGLARGKLAMYVEGTLRKEAHFAPIAWMRRSSGALPADSELKDWANITF